MNRRSILSLMVAAGLAGASTASAQGDFFKGALRKIGKTAVSNAVSNQEPASETTTERVAGAVKTAKAFRKGFQDISESEEFFIGRSVAAQILSRYRPYQDAKLNRYVQSVLQVVAQASDRPMIFKGYHAQVLDSDEVNAFAAPGGFVFLTSGLVRLLENEDQLGCVLAHEVGHITAKHGLKVIKTSRLTTAFELLGQEAAKNAGSKQAAQLTEAFGGSVDDIVNNLVVNGYSRDLELAADKLGVGYARQANYQPQALVQVLSRMGGSGSARWGFSKNHPSTQQRLAQLQSLDLSPSAQFKASEARRKRFAAACASLAH